jgi:hypothetical protein
MSIGKRKSLMSLKYSLDELFAMHELPIDANAEAEQYAEKFSDGALMVAMEMLRGRKITQGFGELTHFDTTGKPDCIFKYQKGVCVHISPIEWIDKKNVIKGSIKIHNLNKRKEE